MQLASFHTAETSSYGVVKADKILDIGAASSVPTLREALENGLDWIAEQAESAEAVPISAVVFDPVIPNPSKVICVGINTKSHFEESRDYTGLKEHPAKPWLFVRTTDSLVGHDQPILLPSVSEALDYEAELAVVIGKHARNVSAEDAMSYVAGFAPFNDASIRDYQIHTPQITAGKIFPATGGFGPWMTTLDEAPAMEDIKLELVLNGSVLQTLTLDDLIIPIPDIIAYCSEVTDLRPGDVIVTGSPEGVGAFHDPYLWMKEGDQVVVRGGPLGNLENPVMRDSGAAGGS
ncbi:fumarylacetoacetate hydrolase family protein [Nitratireductor sp. XY-223]|uniref:fumarylacetoacetate hydrolase family protein n=1 Tax=Nitratireductor sp. XY-223 TaxID=2561926 RepID=UPI0010AA1AFA|nr:fumarylacetoacetate hydrolase family protein [Nitratireductor sp. XY-223]